MIYIGNVEFRTAKSAGYLGNAGYNKCSQYLLERIGSFFDEKQIQGKDVDIIFETKRNHDYFRLQRFLKSICRKPLDPRAAKLQHLDPIIISNKDKNEEPCLFLADLTAYSLLRAFYPEGNKLKISEQRYLRELKNAFHTSNKTGQIANHGIKFIKGPVNMGLKDREYEFAMKFYKAKEA